jgi:predicted MFS family arabinose efflux permease
LPGLRGLVYLSVLAFASFFLTLSSLPLYSISIGTPAGAAGLVTTVMLAATVAMQTLVPMLVNRFGLLPVLALGLVMLGAPAPLYLVGHQFWWVLLISALRGVGFAVITVLMPLAASRLVPPGRRGEAIGVYGLAIAIPNLVGVPIGVALTSAGHFGWVAVAAASPLLALPLLPSIGRSIRPPEANATPASSAATAATLRAVAPAVLVLLVITLSGGGVLTFLPVARPSGSLATAALLAFGVTGAVGRWRAGVLSDRLGARVLLPASVLLAAGGMGVLAAGLVTDAPVLVLIGAATLGIGYGSAQNVTLVVAFERAGPANETTASAVWNACYDAGTAIGALLVGLVAAAGPGFGWTFAGCAVLIAMSLPLSLGATRTSR